GNWIASRSEERAAFIVMGDFNRLPPASENDEFWRLVQTGPTQLLAMRLPFSNCFAGQPFSGFIDHMLLSSSLERRLVPDSPRHFAYSNADAVRFHLSDH